MFLDPLNSNLTSIFDLSPLGLATGLQKFFYLQKIQKNLFLGDFALQALLRKAFRSHEILYLYFLPKPGRTPD